MPTRSDVAALCKINPSTVSRALSGHQGIPQSTRQKILSVSRQIGYTPSQLGRSLQQKKSYRLGLLLPFSYNRKLHTFPHEYFSKLLYGIIKTAAEHLYTISVIADQNLKAAELISLVHSGSVDGLLLPSLRIEDLRPQNLYREKIPFVLVHHYFKNKNWPYVDCSAESGMREAFDFLKKNGISKIGFLGGDPDYVNARDRRKIFSILAAEYKMKVSHIIKGDFSRSSGLKAAGIFRGKSRPHAVFCANDRMAWGLICGLKACGIKVPDHMRVIGFDNQDIASLSVPKISTVENPFFEIGSRAAEKLIAVINGEKQAGESIAGKFIPGES
ncbi:MAG: hypothetical protein A2096_09920 [Spirochaetes bacterium GWF1_41_5]|nr:MAG: hypothetical protein A2096_09920 [Spirochaetes bacterium GWF1_41_5]